MTDGEAESDADAGTDGDTHAGTDGDTHAGTDGSADRGAPVGTDGEPGRAPDRPAKDPGPLGVDETTADRTVSGPETSTSTEGEESAGVSGGPSESSVTPEEIDVESLTGPIRRLDPRVRYVWVLGSIVGSLMLGAIAGVAGFVALGRPVIGPAVFLFVFALGAVMAVLRYRTWSYEVREDSLFLERGVLTRVRTVVPYVRIQHVDASRGPVERSLGLATVVVYTAGSRGADVSIPGLTTDRADDLQERLERLAIAAEGEDAV